MDWSLVLASQGIEVVLDRVPDSKDWVLLIAAKDMSSARHAIRQFRLENRRFSWRKEIGPSRQPFHAGALLWLFAIILVHAGVDRLRPAGAFVSDEVHRGQWW